MIVCVCHRISDREITRFARAGMGFDEIQLELGVATQCGNCEGCARELVSQCHASAPSRQCTMMPMPSGHVLAPAETMEPVSTLAVCLLLVVAGSVWTFRR